MSIRLPDYLAVAAGDIGRGTAAKVHVAGDLPGVARHFAAALFDQITRKPDATLILPVGPVDHYPILAERINEARLDCRDLTIINMDEYLDDDDRWVPLDHPLSFRGYMDRMFYDRVEPGLVPRSENRHFPHPGKPEATGQLIDARGGVDACYGGIGINGHIAFNEPPEPDEPLDDRSFLALPTRVLSLSRETRTINSNTVGGELAVIPRRAVTVGMREIAAARQLRLYCNRPWQSAVVRRVLHGPMTAGCPTSLLRMHANLVVVLADYVAARPDIRLR